MNASLFINSSLSSLSSTSPAVCPGGFLPLVAGSGGGGCLAGGLESLRGRGVSQGEGEGIGEGERVGDISVKLPYIVLPHGALP